MSEVKMIKFVVKRYDPERKCFFTSTYEVPVRRGMTLLDALLYIKENLDETLAFRYSCRMSICGSCAIKVNGKPMLACFTQVLDLGTDTIVLEPLSNLPPIRDLVVDFGPFFKHMKDIRPYLIRPPGEPEEEFIQRPEEFKRYWPLARCTSCSSCVAACPASIDDAFLGPSALMSAYRFMIDTRDAGLGERLKLISETVWLCTSCNSCTLVCPKEIDVSSSITEAKSLLVEEGRIARRIADVLEAAMTYHNPLGRLQARRPEWMEGLEPPLPLASELGRAPRLLFVCCLPAFEPRHQEVARLAASLLRSSGLKDLATLGKDEWCCGDHILRMGEKGLFEELAEHNTSMFERYGVEEVVTLSPHCYYVFKNEQPYKGLGIEVRHYTEVLAEAVSSGELRPSRSLGGLRVAYHDPCFLGKRSGIYEAPRALLSSLPGLELVEFERNRENSFCCGGGAGRVWTEEAEPEKRPSVNRLREALELGVDVIATACPFCTCMLEDAAKVLDVEEKIRIMDVAELLARALGLT